MNPDIPTNSPQNYTKGPQYRIKRLHSTMAPQENGFYSVASKKYKYNTNGIDQNRNFSLNQVGIEKKYSPVFYSGALADIEMSSQNYTDTQDTKVEYKKLYQEKMKNEMSNYYNQVNRCNSRFLINYTCCNK